MTTQKGQEKKWILNFYLRAKTVVEEIFNKNKKPKNLGHLYKKTDKHTEWLPVPEFSLGEI